MIIVYFLRDINRRFPLQFKGNARKHFRFFFNYQKQIRLFTFCRTFSLNPNCSTHRNNCLFQMDKQILVLVGIVFVCFFSGRGKKKKKEFWISKSPLEISLIFVFFFLISFSFVFWRWGTFGARFVSWLQ